jgi:LPXTG-motif cell wall-anchored protein
MSRFGLGIDEEARDVARRWPYRFLIAAALVLFVATPAAADPDASPSREPEAPSAPVYARDVPACGRLTPLPDTDRWLLTPATEADARTRLDLIFLDGLGETHSVAAEASVDGAAHARTPAGWSLSRAPTGYRVAACPAAAKLEKAPDLIAGAPPASSSSPSRPAPTSSKQALAANAPRLANTGQDTGAMVLLGVTLVLAGALLLIVRRRPKEAPAPAPAPAALYWVTAELPIVEPRTATDSDH